MSQKPTLVLSRQDVRDLLTLDECVDAVEEAFRKQSLGVEPPPAVLGYHLERGGFHVKTAAGGSYVALKLNANFPLNRRDFGMPTIQGVVLLSDARNGYPLALMDSTEITILRTGAASAVAARYLARRDSSVLTLCGCGLQGRVQVQALARVLTLRNILAFDTDKDVQTRFVDEMTDSAGIHVIPADDLGRAVRQSDVVVTCTPARKPFLRTEWIRPGMFIAAVGADSEEKQELDPEILRISRVVADIPDQCASIGELHHAIENGLMSIDDVHASLGDVVAGKRPGRESADQIFVFDSTGTAIQDVAAATLVFERAVEAGRGRRFDFFA